MRFEQHSRLLTQELLAQMRAQRGSQAKACRLAGVNRNYFIDCAERGSIGLRQLLAALEVLGIHPTIFFSQHLPKSLKDLAGAVDG